MLGAAASSRESAAVKYLAVLLVACGAAQHPRPTGGSIGGLARDHDSGDPVAHAEVRIRAQGQIQPLVAKTSNDGLFSVEHLAPGKYSLTAWFAGQAVNIENIIVRDAEPTIVDVTFTLGRPDAVTYDFGSAKDSAIDHYKPKNLAPTDSIIEGTISDLGTRERVGGAVVTAIGGPLSETVQTVTDDQGRYRFPRVSPGTYAVSAYYSIGGRGQIEVRRSGIEVRGAEAVIVPLWVETAKQ